MAADDGVQLDPRWEWAELHVPESAAAVAWIRVACRHLETVPVQLVTGEVVARLCLTCDGQLPPPVEPIHGGIPPSGIG